MLHTFARRAAVVLAIVATAGCMVHNKEVPAVSGPSGLALSLSLNAIPDSINQDGGSQASIRVLAIGPDGKPVSALPMRVDMVVSGVPQDYGTLSARTIVTNADGVATVVYTAPPSPPNGVFGTCGSLPGTCVTIVATPTGTNFQTSNFEGVTIRLVPPGVILPPASTPTAAFRFSPQAAAANLPVQFDASTSQPGNGASQIVSYNWTFGDGTTGVGKTISHTFTTPNTYSVTLTVTNDRNLSGSTNQQVAVAGGALPTPSFTFSPAVPAVAESVFFNASTSTAGSGHTIVSYRWAFGDGGTASGVTVSHAFAAAGSYIVQLTVTDEAGQSATSGGTTITPGNPPGPSANFTFSPASPVVGDVVVFDWRTTTTSQGQRIVSLDWNFGDGTAIVHCPGDPACTSEGITTHTFSRSGIFAVNLVVTDSAGRTNAKSSAVTVGGGNPTAILIVTKTGGLTIQADGSTSSASGGATITNYTFFWGDGSAPTSGSSSAASHIYSGAGTYTVTLRVTDSLSRTGSSAPQNVTVP